MLQDLRSKMPEGFSVYMSESAVLALIVSSRSAVLKSVIITLICMAVICLVFFPTLRGAICAITSVASITIGKILCCCITTVIILKKFLVKML